MRTGSTKRPVASGQPEGGVVACKMMQYLSMRHRVPAGRSLRQRATLFSFTRCSHPRLNVPSLMNYRRLLMPGGMDSSAMWFMFGDL